MMLQPLIQSAVRSFVDALPPDWHRAWLRVEFQPDGSGGTISAFYASESNEPSPVSLAPAQLLQWQALRNQMARDAEAWTSTTLSLSNDGHFDLHHDYEPLGDEPAMTRHSSWAHSLRAK